VLNESSFQFNASMSSANTNILDTAPFTRTADGSIAFPFLAPNGELSVSFFASSSSLLNDTYSYNATYSMTVSSLLPLNVMVVVRVGGQPIDPSDSVTVVVDSFKLDIAATNNITISRSAALGLTTLRHVGFSMSFNVSNIGSSYIFVSMSSLQLVPTFQRPNIGINQPNLVWSNNPLPLLAAISNVGSSWLRTDMRAVDIDTLSTVFGQAAEHHMRTIAILQPTLSSDYSHYNDTYPNPTGFDNSCGEQGPALPISQINVTLFVQRHDMCFKQLARRNVTIDVFEIFNEMVSTHHKSSELLVVVFYIL
jgi:hypothetical protein